MQNCYLNILTFFFHLLLKAIKATENEKFIISFSPRFFATWSAFVCFDFYSACWQARCSLLVQENNNKLWNKALKFYLSFVYLALALNEKLAVIWATIREFLATLSRVLADLEESFLIKNERMNGNGWELKRLFGVVQFFSPVKFRG